MRIEDIIANISNYVGVTSDSRNVTPGMIYVAIKGVSFNGEDYIQEAIEKGAAAVVSENAHGHDVLLTDNARKALALLASHYYRQKPDNIVMVTGTNGKTSVAYFYKQIFEYLGYKSASIGTLGVVSEFFRYKVEGTLTSPDAITLNYLLSEMKKEGIEHVAIEASSHGLDQYRLDYIPIRAAAFTNLTQDHLDYHQSMEEYFQAKLRLFSELLEGGAAVLNHDIKEFETLRALCSHVISYGKTSPDLQLISFVNSFIEFEYFGMVYVVQTKLNGEFQAYNLLAAIGLALAVGAFIDDIIAVIPLIDAAPGRLELVGNMENGAKVFLDYAHTPDALHNALTNLRKECAGKLYVLFGCGGDRDKEKRFQMGEIAYKLADFTYVTDDNPRSEDPAKIRAEVMKALPSNAVEIGSRAKALAEAIAQLKEGDVLLVAGKGHETYQIIGREKVYFSDAEEIMRNLK